MDYHHATIQPGTSKTPPFSLEVPNSPVIKGETLPRRHPQCVNGLRSIPQPNIKTLYDVLLRSAREYGNLPAVGARNLIGEHKEVKLVKKVVGGKEKEVEKKWTYFEMGKFEYLTYGEYVKAAVEIGAGLRELGMTKGDRLHMFASTRYVILLGGNSSTEWLMSDSVHTGCLSPMVCQGIIRELCTIDRK